MDCRWGNGQTAATCGCLDDETWQFHLKNGDISRWFREVIKDHELAREAELMERDDVAAAESRKYIRAQIEQRYIVPV